MLILGFGNLIATIIWIIVYLACVGPVLIGGWYYYKWFTNPSWETKKKLPKAHLYNIASVLLQFACFTIFGIILNSGKPYMVGAVATNDSVDSGSIWITNIVSAIVNSGLNYYWMGVTARFSNM